MKITSLKGYNLDYRAVEILNNSLFLYCYFAFAIFKVKLKSDIWSFQSAVYVLLDRSGRIEIGEGSLTWALLPSLCEYDLSHHWPWQGTWLCRGSLCVPFMLDEDLPKQVFSLYLSQKLRLWRCSFKTIDNVEMEHSPPAASNIREQITISFALYLCFFLSAWSLVLCALPQSVVMWALSDTDVRAVSEEHSCVYHATPCTLGTSHIISGLSSDCIQHTGRGKGMSVRPLASSFVPRLFGGRNKLQGFWTNCLVFML